MFIYTPFISPLGEDVVLNRTCGECGGILVLSSNGEYVCERCGLVYDAEVVSSLYQREDCGNRGINPCQYVEVLDKYPMSSTISYRPLRGSSGNHGDSLKKLDYYKKLDFIQRFCISGLPLKSIRRAYSVLISLCSLVSHYEALDVKRRALELYYSTVMKNKALKKNHVALIASCFYIAIKERNKHLRAELNLRRIVEHVRKMGIHVTISNIFKALFLVRKATGVVLRLRRTEELITSAACQIVAQDKLRLKMKRNGIDPLHYTKKLVEEAKSVLQRVGNLNGKNPFSIVVTAIYVADKILAAKNGWKTLLTQKTVSAIFNISPFTVRETYHKLFRKMLVEGGVCKSGGGL